MATDHPADIVSNLTSAQRRLKNMLSVAPPSPTHLEHQMLSEISQDPTQKVGKVLMPLSPLQLARLDKLISSFAKRDKKQVYLNAQIQVDEAQKIWFTCLDRTDSAKPMIRRHNDKLAIESGRNYAKAFTSEFAGRAAEHNVLDLFLTACKRLPGFTAATVRRYKERVSACVVKKAVAPLPYDGCEPPLMFTPALFDHHEVLPSAMTNALAIGSTGSGKTVSFILPALRSMLDYRLSDGKVASLLVIDPKVELLNAAKYKLTALGELSRLIVVGQCDPINYFQDSDGLSVSDRFEKVKSFMVISSQRGDDNRWQVFAEQLILALLKDDQQFANVCQLPLLESVAALVTGEDHYLERNQWVALRKLLLLGMEDPVNLRHIADVYDVLTFSVGMTRMDRPFARYTALKDGDQFFYNARGALTVVDGLGSNDIEHLMDFSVRRNLKKGRRTEVAELVESGRVIVFQPAQVATHDLVGAALKSLFFRTVMERQDMQRPMGYFCDEFQRFITADPETGEHTFLDRCRAYRVNCFLATQSMAALMAATGKGINGFSSSLDSILVNTPTKLCFRTTDMHAVATMKAFIPRDPQSEQHVLNFRPPSSLLVGEYYFAIGHQWGRTRYQLAAPTTLPATSASSDSPDPFKRFERSKPSQQKSTRGVSN